MDFRKATDNLCEGVSHAELARALGVSVASVRQARLDAEAKAHRAPPVGWEAAVIQLAEEQALHYKRLATRLRKAAPPETGV